MDNLTSRFKHLIGFYTALMRLYGERVNCLLFKMEIDLLSWEILEFFRYDAYAKMPLGAGWWDLI